MVSTYIELKGVFRFAINESGLDYNDLDEREEAINDFKMELIQWANNAGDYVTIEFDEQDIEVSAGEEMRRVNLDAEFEIFKEKFCELHDLEGAWRRYQDMEGLIDITNTGG